MNHLYTSSKPIAKTVCFLLACFCTGMAAAQCTNTSAATSYTSNNGSRGAMFNITAGANPVTITSFDGNLYGGTTARYEIYYKAGSYVGSETNAAAWTLAGGVNNLYVAANNVPTPIPIPLNITIPAGATYGFYLTNTASGGINYTSSAVTGVTLISNSDLTLTGGVGKSYPFGSTYSYRLVNCTVHYYVGSITETSTLATTTTTSPAFNQNSSGTTFYGANCEALIAKVIGTGGSPVSGNTTAKVWIDGTQQRQYVKRHYQITPGTNGSGRVTLYFTDAEFNDYNTQTPAPALLLPVSTSPGTVAERKANLLIQKNSGSSSDDSGQPLSYPGATQTINPADEDIVWNATASRWEVTFDVSGFSGFFVKTSLFTLPLKLLSFTGSREKNVIDLQWRTADEVNTKSFLVERSADGSAFHVIGSIAAGNNGGHSYTYKDQFNFNGNVYYRLKMVDADDRSTYSNILRLSNDAAIGNARISVYPNPVKDQATISFSNNEWVGSMARLTDLSGKTIKEMRLTSNFEILDLSGLSAGIYLLRLNNGVVQKVVKE